MRRARLVVTGLMAGLVMAGPALAGCDSHKDPQVATARSDGARPATSSAPATGGDVATYVEGMRAWVACLRAEGVDVSDPDATGAVTFLGDPAVFKSDPKFVAAQAKCRSIEPAVPESVIEKRRPKLTPEQIATQRRYSDCMQHNGAPDFPDPGPDGYLDRGGTSWNQASDGAKRATAACAGIIGDPTDQPTTRG